MPGQAHPAAHRVGLAHDVVAEHPRRAGIRAEQGSEHPDRRCLARAVRPQETIDHAPAHGQGDAFDGPGLAERLDEARSLDGEIRMRVQYRHTPYPN